MLALLDGIPGVLDSRVDRSGRYFLLALEPGQDEAQVLEASRESLEDARRVDRATEAELLAGYRRGETWLRSDDTLELSREEARILARRDGTRAALELGLDQGRTEKLVRLVEEETARAFERVHAAGRGLDEGARAEFRAAGERIVERSRAFLAAEEVDRLRTFVEEHLAIRRPSVRAPGSVSAPREPPRAR